MMESVRWPVLVPWLGSLLLAAGVPSQETSGSSETLRYVVPVELPLLTVPAEQGAPRVGELLRGSAVRVHEERDGFARVTVQGWVALDGLATHRPAATVPLSPPPSSRRVVGLERAHRIHVEVDRVTRAGEEVTLAVRLRAVTITGRTVHHDGARLATLAVYEEQRIAGGRTRGPRLWQEEQTLDSPVTSLNVTLKAPEAQRALFTVRIKVGESRVIYGSLASISLEG